MELLGSLLVITSPLLAIACIIMFIVFVIRWIMKRSKKWFGFIAAACSALAIFTLISGALMIPPSETNEEELSNTETTSAVTEPSAVLESSVSTSSPSTTALIQTLATSAPPTLDESTVSASTPETSATTPPTTTVLNTQTQTFATTTQETTFEVSLSTEIIYPPEGTLSVYSGAPYVVLNQNIPNFTTADLTTKSFEYYSELDALGRCGMTFACIGQDIMPTEERGAIGQVKPTGWHTVKYDIVDGKYLYNRCHLIGFQLTGENANVCNLITGTRSMNMDGMLPFENMVADYVKETGNHVLYRVIPIFEGTELLARGVTIEAYSVEDDGEGICFNVFVYNVQPGIEIDYATGASKLVASVETTTSTTHTTTKASETTTTKAPQTTPPASTTTTTVAPPPVTTSETTTQTTTKVTTQQTTTQETTTQTSVTTVQTTATEQPQTSIPADCKYILNTNSMKFHHPSCHSAAKIKDSNREYSKQTREELIAIGYSPCGNCDP